jgi:diguanylate cyclase (GGDEF)-like protein
VGNRKQFEAELKSSIAQARSFKGSLALLMVDIDRFKLVNDTFGHLAGDCVLTELAQRMQSVIQGIGTLCRYGGEEFAVILPGAGRREAMRAAEAVRRAAADKAFSAGHSHQGREINTSHRQRRRGAV